MVGVEFCNQLCASLNVTIVELSVRGVALLFCREHSPKYLVIAAGGPTDLDKSIPRACVKVAVDYKVETRTPIKSLVVKEKLEIEWTSVFTDYLAGTLFKPGPTS